MGETHARGMEGGWNSSEVWPVPVPDCLLNGMNATEAHIMFGGSHMLQQQFRHRFQPPMHFTSSSHLIPIPGSINVNIPIPSHPMIENGGQVQVDNDGNGPSLNSDENGQSGIPQNIPMDGSDVLDDTDDVSDDEDEEEADDEEMSIQIAHSQDVGQLSMNHPMRDESLVQVQCQQVPVVQDPLVHQQQTTMIPMTEAHCHHQQKLGMSGNDMSSHQQHSLQPQTSHGPSMEPIFPQQPDEFDAQQAQGGNNDPNSGFSVYGKMYFEGRVVLHLKQSGDSDIGIVGGGGMGFSSCGVPEPPKPHLHGCAFCRLRSPQDTIRSQKEAHRHTVKGVLFTFEDCIIVELYPEQVNGPIHNSNGSSQKPTNSQVKSTNLSNQPMSIPTYMTSSAMPTHVEPQHSAEKILMEQQHMDLNPLNSQQQSHIPPPLPSPQRKGDNVQPNAPEEHHSWWEEFESDGDDELKDVEETTEEEESNQPTEYAQPASYLRPKLNPQQHLHEPQIDLEPVDSNEDEEDEEDEEEEEHCDDDVYSSPKYKCNDCSCSFQTSLHLSSHHCHTIDSITNFTSCSNTDDLGTAQNMSVPSSIDELNLSSSSGTNMDLGLSDRNTDKRPETEIQSMHINSPISVEEGSCQSIAVTTTSTLKLEKVKVPHSGRVKGKYSCPSCTKAFPLKKSLKEHLEAEHSDGNPYRCTKCSLQLTDGNQIDKHVCSVTSQRRIKRLQNLKEKEEPKQPSKSPEVETIPSASDVEVENINRSRLKDDEILRKKSHKEKESNSKRRHNTSENIVLKSKRNLRHRETVLENRVELEDEDDPDEAPSPRVKSKSKKRKSSGTSSGSKFHFKKGSLEMKTRKSFKFNSRKPFCCDICGKGFTVQRRLENHKHSHGTEKSAQCEKCGKRFARRDKLMRHMYVHSEEKMFACEKCSKRFSRRDKLMDHLKSHGGPDEIHKCPMCKKEFLRPDILKQHEKLHTIGNKHQCTECLRFVTGKERLEQHMARHEEAKAQGQTLLCPLCTKNFIQRQSLKAHIKRFHPTAHRSILSSLDFPPTKDTAVEHEPEEPDESSGSSKDQSEQFSCHQCPYPKLFTDRDAFNKHLRKHAKNEEKARLNSRSHKSPSKKTKYKRVDLENESELEPKEVGEVDTSHSVQEEPSSCLFTSVASQILNSPTHVTPCQSPALSCLEPVPAHTILPTQHPPTPPIPHFSLSSHSQHRHHHHLNTTSGAPPAHHPLSLAAVSVAPSVVVSAQQNGLLGIGTHPNHGLHHHHLLQHSHGHSLPMGQGFPHPPMAHPHLGQHVSMSTIQHHVNVNMATQQSMCGSPYVIYPHYPYQ